VLLSFYILLLLLLDLRSNIFVIHKSSQFVLVVLVVSFFIVNRGSRSYELIV
jgi:hypothetical protein